VIVGTIFIQCRHQLVGGRFSIQSARERLPTKFTANWCSTWVMVHGLREARAISVPDLWSMTGGDVQVDNLQQHQQSGEANNFAIVALAERSIGYARVSICRLT
jgi:hypothetical protein